MYNLIFLSANLQHSHLIRLLVLYQSAHNLHLLFCCILSISTSIQLVLMGLFSGAIWIISVSFSRFHFCNYVRILSCKILPICCLEYIYSLPYHFCCQVIVVLFVLTISMLLLAALINPSWLFLMLSSSCRIDLSTTLCSMFANPLPPSFLDTGGPFMLCSSSSIFLSSSSFVLLLLSIFRMIPSILQGWCNPDFYPFQDISAAELAFEKLSRSSEVHLLFFLYFCLFDGARFQDFQMTIISPFFRYFLFFLDLAVLWTSIICVFPFGMAHFAHKNLFLYLHCIFLLCVLEPLILFHFFPNSVISWISWSIFPRNLLNLNPPLHFQTKKCCGIFATTNSLVKTLEDSSLDLYLS